MLGSTFIYEDEPSRLRALRSPDALDDLDFIQLEVMSTLDFESILGAEDLDWAEGPAVLLDEARGVAVFKISEAALLYVLAHKQGLNVHQRSDISELSRFVLDRGAGHIYEFTTF